MNKETVEGITISVVAVAAFAMLSFMVYIAQTAPEYHHSPLTRCIMGANTTHPNYTIDACETFIFSEDDETVYNEMTNEEG